MQSPPISAPTPDLRIVDTLRVHPHEEHDSQRAEPLIRTIRAAQYFTNPPIVVELEADDYMILDGANRCYAFQYLEYPHLLVQVASYTSGFVTLGVWQHVVSHWDAATFEAHLNQIEGVTLSDTSDETTIARIIFRDGRRLAVNVPVGDVRERNAALRRLVAVYQQNAVLHRTAIDEPHQTWAIYPEAVALVLFPAYEPDDIMDAARYHAFLPPGVSRHIIHGRAIRLNYPLEALLDSEATLEHKNLALQTWLQERFANRQVRYYAEATYQFDE